VIRYCLAVGLAVLTLSASAFATEKPLRVCADPDYMPFSNRAGDGFENKIAELVAKSLGRKLEYTWHSYRGHGGFGEFLAQTLDAKKCDLVINMPYGSQEELTTNPYYASSYVFVFKKKKGYDIESMDSPVLRKLKIGFERETPPADGLKIRDMLFDAIAFHVGDEKGESPAVMLQAVEDGKVDVMITWEPAIGYFIKNYPGLEVARVPNERATGSPEQYMFSMSMAVRKNDTALQQELNKFIAQHKSDIKAILDSYNVRLYPVAGGEIL
jgi:mxaJ protein